MVEDYLLFILGAGTVIVLIMLAGLYSQIKKWVSNVNRSVDTVNSYRNGNEALLKEIRSFPSSKELYDIVREYRKSKAERPEIDE